MTMSRDTSDGPDSEGSTGIEERLDRLESLVEQQQETIEAQQAELDRRAEQLDQLRAANELGDDEPTADGTANTDRSSTEPSSSPSDPARDTDFDGVDTETDDDLPGSAATRRAVLTSGSVLGLFGLGVGSASADSQGQVGTAADPLSALYTAELYGNSGTVTVQDDLDLNGYTLTSTSVGTDFLTDIDSTVTSEEDFSIEIEDVSGNKPTVQWRRESNTDNALAVMTIDGGTTRSRLLLDDDGNLNIAGDLTSSDALTVETISNGDLTLNAAGNVVVDSTFDLNGNDIENNGTTVWDAGNKYFPQASLENDSVTVSSGTGLAGGGDVSLGGSTTLDIASGGVGSDEIASDGVGTDEIATSVVTDTELASDSVKSSQIATDAVGTDQIAGSTVGSNELADSVSLTNLTVDGEIDLVDAILQIPVANLSGASNDRPGYLKAYWNNDPPQLQVNGPNGNDLKTWSADGGHWYRDEPAWNEAMDNDLDDHLVDETRCFDTGAPFEVGDPLVHIVNRRKRDTNGDYEWDKIHAVPLSLEAAFDRSETITQQRDRLANLETRCDARDDRINDLEVETKSLREENEQLSEKNNRLKERNAELETRLKRVEAELGLDATVERQGIADD